MYLKRKFIPKDELNAVLLDQAITEFKLGGKESEFSDFYYRSEGDVLDALDPPANLVAAKCTLRSKSPLGPDSNILIARYQIVSVSCLI